MESILVKLAGLVVTGFKLAASSIFGRLMAGAGLSIVSFTLVYPQIRAFLASKFLALPANAQQLLAYCGVDVFMTLIISAVVARAGMQVFNMVTAKLDSMLGQAAT